MSIASVRRRLSSLEGSGVFTPPRTYRPFTPTEIQAIALRIEDDDRLSADELHRMEQHTPLVDHEVLISAHNGGVFMKRYIGIDLAEL
jgi:hypothetical protein